MRFTLVAGALGAAALAALAQTAVPPTEPPAPRMVGEGVVSTPAYEGSASVSPDGRTLYIAKRPAVPYFWVICESRWTDDGWSAPRVASFSGRFSDTDPFVSPDGTRLLFVSTRDGSGGTKSDYDIWMMERAGDGWGEPRRLDAPVNSPANELHPTIDRDGTLYFASDRPGGGGVDIYAAPLENGRWSAPVRLDSTINSPRPENHPAISPDGRTLVFVSVGRPEEPLPAGVPYPRGDLYASRRESSGWTAPRRLPDGVNSLAAETSPAFSADGARLLFTSEVGFASVPFTAPITYREFAAGVRGIRNGLGNLYEVDARVLQEAR